MRGWQTLLLSLGAVAVLAVIVIVPEWHLPVKGHELGWRASSMIQFDLPPAEAALLKRPPPPIPGWGHDPRPAGVAYKNVTVLTNVDAGEFMHTMTAMTSWVSPKQGCGFCHAGADYASDAKPAKAVARLMLQMTRHINADWRDHVGAAGVTCFSCHQGQPIPSDVWFAAPPVRQHPMIDWQEDYHEDELTVRKFFPDEGYEEYLLQNTPGSSQSYTALPTHSGSSQVVIKRMYEVMMQMSDGIGVNCGYCHNSRAFFDWRQSTPARWTGYSGIQMTRDLNRHFLIKTGALLPQSRYRLDKAHERNLAPDQAGPMPGNGLSNCATCHHGEPKPLGGANMVDAYPALIDPEPSPSGKVASAAVSTPAPR
jgi:photosynthetic reaction center cytochrome c subunit